MSIYIRGMKMPKNCNECPTCRDGMTLDGDYWLMCRYNGKPLESEIAAGKPDWCPLVSIPPHGRCVDADALTQQIEYERFHHPHTDGLAMRHHIAEYGHFLKVISDAPTIITADQVEDEKT